MLRIFTVFLLSFTLGSAFGQQQAWKQLEQPVIRLKYLVPEGWYVGGFKPTHKCKCTGAVVNTSDDGLINMVIFYSDQQNIDSLSRQKVWGYTYSTAQNKSARGVQSSQLAFSHDVSVWEEDPNITVLRLKTQIEGNNYLFYFWGTPDNLQKHNPDIERIVQSVEVYRE